MQTVFENSLMQHHVALSPDAMGKITYIAPPGQYSLKVCLPYLLFLTILVIPCNVSLQSSVLRWNFCFDIQKWEKQ